MSYYEAFCRMVDKEEQFCLELAVLEEPFRPALMDQIELLKGIAGFDAVNRLLEAKNAIEYIHLEHAFNRGYAEGQRALARSVLDELAAYQQAFSARFSALVSLVQEPTPEPDEESPGET